ncbi:glycosyltransferase [Jatrophihabitans sp. DSM 45814]
MTGPRLLGGGRLATPQETSDLTVVIPARSRVEPLLDLFEAIPEDVAVIVVDDGSAVALEGQLPHRAKLTVVRHDVPRGPARARNVGAALARTSWVAFVDADISAAGPWLAALQSHLEPGIIAIAPRVRSAAAFGPAGSLGMAALLQRHASGFDLGRVGGDVQAAGQLTFLPSAAFIVQRQAFEVVGGFCEDLNVGEDVDLVWRLLAFGRVRYEPSVVVCHASVPSLAAVLRRRYDYGTGAALLDQRHRGLLRHADVSIFSLVPWLLGISGHVRLAAATVLATLLAAAVPAAPERTAPPAAVAFRYAAHGQLTAGRALGSWLVRPMWPLTLVVCLLLRKQRPFIAGAVAIGLAERIRRAQPEDDGVSASTVGRFVAVGEGAGALLATVVDDLAYSLGVWHGCLRSGRWAPLLPRVRDLPYQRTRRQRTRRQRTSRQGTRWQRKTGQPCPQ